MVLIDTAGRLQNKQGLMDELLKIIRVVKKVDPDAPHETLLVLDATVGRNALAQENIFGNQIGVSGIVMTKLDGTARGGVLVPVAQASDSPDQADRASARGSTTCSRSTRAPSPAPWWAWRSRSR